MTEGTFVSLSKVIVQRRAVFGVHQRKVRRHGKAFPSRGPRSWNWGWGLLLKKATQSLKIGHFVLPGLGWGLARRWRNWSETSRELTLASEMR